jgi:hypothetical protein
VADAGESEGAEEFGFEAGGGGELVRGGEIDDKLAGGDAGLASFSERHQPA